MIIPAHSGCSHSVPATSSRSLDARSSHFGPQHNWPPYQPTHVMPSIRRYLKNWQELRNSGGSMQLMRLHSSSCKAPPAFRNSASVRLDNPALWGDWRNDPGSSPDGGVAMDEMPGFLPAICATCSRSTSGHLNGRQFLIAQPHDVQFSSLHIHGWHCFFLLNQLPSPAPTSNSIADKIHPPTHALFSAFITRQHRLAGACHGATIVGPAAAGGL